MGNLKDINYGIGKYLELSDASDIPDIGTNRTNLDLLNFKVATNNAYALYNFKDGMIDAYQTEAGVDTGTSNNETYDSTNKLYSPTLIAAAFYSFTSTGSATWTCPAGITSIEVLTVAGGGGGGGSVGVDNQDGGGGSGGGVVHHSTYTVVPAVVYDLTVGAGGAAGSGTADGSVGSNSVFNVNAEGSGATMTALGGGYGGGGISENVGRDGGDGGSGGGGGPNSSGGTGNQAGSGGGTGYGNDGGDGDTSTSGGGGGAAAAGATGVNPTGGAGGAGRLFSTFTSYGANTGYFAGGGGGGQAGAGGIGGGGAGGYNTPGGAGTANTGGGGGGGEEAPGGAGGSGVVLIYISAGALNMTLISNAQTAQAAPDEGRLMIYEETSTGSTTLDTDLKGYVSRDGGTTYTQTPLTEDTIYGQAGMDQYTKLMLHCDGSNGGTTFTDSSDSPHTVTPTGNTHTDTAVKKFGTAAAQFDGTGDNLSIPDSADWEFGAGEFTIDTWVYATTTTAAAVVVQQGVVTGNDRSFWLRFKYDGTNLMCFAWSTDGTWQTKQLADPDAFPTGQWVHVAITRDSNTLRLYIDGVQKNSTTETGSLHNSTQALYVGSDADATNSWNGYMDEIRISNTCRYPNGTTFTPPTTAYGNNQRLLSGSVDISGQPSGTSMKYKIETLNQSSSKVCRLHGASLLWA